MILFSSFTLRSKSTFIFLRFNLFFSKIAWNNKIILIKSKILYNKLFLSKYCLMYYINNTNYLYHNWIGIKNFIIELIEIEFRNNY